MKSGIPEEECDKFFKMMQQDNEALKDNDPSDSRDLP